MWGVDAIGPIVDSGKEGRGEWGGERLERRAKDGKEGMMVDGGKDRKRLSSKPNSDQPKPLILLSAITQGLQEFPCGKRMSRPHTLSLRI